LQQVTKLQTEILFFGTSIKDWLPFNATSFLGCSPLMQKQQLRKIKMKTTLLLRPFLCSQNDENFAIKNKKGKNKNSKLHIGSTVSAVAIVCKGVLLLQLQLF